MVTFFDTARFGALEAAIITAGDPDLGALTVTKRLLWVVMVAPRRCDRLVRHPVLGLGGPETSFEQARSAFHQCAESSNLVAQDRRIPWDRGAMGASHVEVQSPPRTSSWLYLVHM